MACPSCTPCNSFSFAQGSHMLVALGVGTLVLAVASPCGHELQLSFAHAQPS